MRVDMVKHFESGRKSKHPSFLVDTPAYQGVSPEFKATETLVSKKLPVELSIQNQFMCESSIRVAVTLMFEIHQRLEFVIAGWVDQAVLEIHSSCQGDSRLLPKVLLQLESYRPAQNGDIWFYMTNLDCNQVLATMISFANKKMITRCYRRSC